MGKAKGHTEALEDPEAMLDGLVRRKLSDAAGMGRASGLSCALSAPCLLWLGCLPLISSRDPSPSQIKGILCSQHVSSTGAQAAFHEVGSPQYEHVRAVGVRVMEAARTFVQSEIKKLETELSVAARRSDAERVAEITAAIEEFKAGARRLTGEWRWVVTNSEVKPMLLSCPHREPTPDAPVLSASPPRVPSGLYPSTPQAINAFVSPYCPRHVFVHEGLMNELRPTDDELAFLIAHEVSHVIHAHADETLARTAAAAQVPCIGGGEDDA
eukprot:scaffold112758_cov29-Tisochrysis_lutea.AAC.2